ncbi:unnamed protein product [Cochlearia groenlandica]
MSRHLNQSSVDENIALFLQYGLIDLTINDDVIAREIQEQYHNKLMCNDIAIALEIQQEEEALMDSCSHDEEFARTLQEMEGNLQRNLSDDEKLARYLQQEDYLNHSYICQRDAPSTSRAFSHCDHCDHASSHLTHTRSPSNISTNSSHEENSTDPTNMTYEELNELEDSIGDVGKGLSVWEISLLPTRKYGTKPKTYWWQKKKKFVADDSQCSICLVDYANGDKILTLPCNHIYHKDCISHWLKQSKACCVCKAEVNT